MCKTADCTDGMVLEVMAIFVEANKLDAAVQVPDPATSDLLMDTGIQGYRDTGMRIGKANYKEAQGTAVSERELQRYMDAAPNNSFFAADFQIDHPDSLGEKSFLECCCQPILALEQRPNLFLERKGAGFLRVVCCSGASGNNRCSSG